MTVYAPGKPLEELVKELPPDIMTEVRDFIEFLLHKREQKTGKTLRQDWAGAIREYREKYTSVDLQHEATNWRSD